MPGLSEQILAIIHENPQLHREHLSLPPEVTGSPQALAGTGAAQAGFGASPQLLAAVQSGLARSSYATGDKASAGQAKHPALRDIHEGSGGLLRPQATDSPGWGRREALSAVDKAFSVAIGGPSGPAPIVHTNQYQGKHAAVGTSADAGAFNPSGGQNMQGASLNGTDNTAQVRLSYAQTVKGLNPLFENFQV